MGLHSWVGENKKSDSYGYFPAISLPLSTITEQSDRQLDSEKQNLLSF